MKTKPLSKDPGDHLVTGNEMALFVTDCIRAVITEYHNHLVESGMLVNPAPIDIQTVEYEPLIELPGNPS